MSSNGFIKLGGSAANALNTNDFGAANTSSRPIIAPLWDDLDGSTPANSKAYYEVTGLAPNRIFTVEWRNWEWNYNSDTPVITFQVKLYETTNVIKFAYRQEATAVNAGSASIGIGSAFGSGAGSFLNITDVNTPAVSSTVSTTNINTKPATGQIYTFTPPLCGSPSSVVTSAITATGATVNWTNGGTETAWRYIVQPSTLNAPASASNAGANVTTKPVVLSGLTPLTSYTIYVRAICDATNKSEWSNVSFVTDAALGTETMNIENNLKIYPNPTTGILNLDLQEEATLSVFDISGKQLLTQKANGNTQLNLSDFAKGIYVLKVANANAETKTLKISKD
jgi:Secretion system C-terminal sorting domain/Fibronectin type III domain